MMRRTRSPFDSEVQGAPPATPTCSSCSCCCVMAAATVVGVVSGATAGIARSSGVSRKLAFLMLLVCISAAAGMSLMFLRMRSMLVGWYVYEVLGDSPVVDLVDVALVVLIALSLSAVGVFRRYGKSYQQIATFVLLLMMLVLVGTVLAIVDFLMQTGVFYGDASWWSSVLYIAGVIGFPVVGFLFVRSLLSRWWVTSGTTAKDARSDNPSTREEVEP